MRRAAVSIASNIAEGNCRQSSKEFRQFLSITLGSIAEVKTQIIIADKIGYLTQDIKADLLNKISELDRMTKALLNSIKN